MKVPTRWDGIVYEKSESYLAYTFENDVLFSKTAMKAILSSTDQHLLKCVLIHWDGKKKCVFFTGNYRSLGQNLSDMDSKRFFEFMISIMRSVVSIRETSILKCSSIDMDLNHIFLDWNKGEACLICLPSDSLQMIPEAEYDIDLRMRMLQWMKKLPLQAQQELNRFTQMITDSGMTLKDIISSGHYTDKAGGPVNDDASSGRAVRYQTPGPDRFGKVRHKEEKNPRILLESADDAGYSFLVNHSPYFIGRDVPSSQGRIDSKYNYVGRRHCKIEWNGTCYLLTDLESRNGTWINQDKLERGGSGVIRAGDMISLMKLSFYVKEAGED